MRTTVTVSDLKEFCAAFGALGLRVGSRTGPGKRNQDDKEWYVVRRFLKTALRAKLFAVPFSVQKRQPPEPDFALETTSRELLAYIEITEATDPADQRELTKFELSDKPVMLLGDFGGRLRDGASQPGKLWASDILDAVGRKKDKAIFVRCDAIRHLVIYPNSNASSLLFDGKDERAAFEYLTEAVENKLDAYAEIVNGCLIHVLGKDFVGFDILGSRRLVRRERKMT